MIQGLHTVSDFGLKLVRLGAGVNGRTEVQDASQFMDNTGEGENCVRGNGQGPQRLLHIYSSPMIFYHFLS